MVAIDPTHPHHCYPVLPSRTLLPSATDTRWSNIWHPDDKLFSFVRCQPSSFNTLGEHSNKSCTVITHFRYLKSRLSPWSPRLWYGLPRIPRSHIKQHPDSPAAARDVHGVIDVTDRDRPHPHYLTYLSTFACGLPK